MCMTILGCVLFLDSLIFPDSLISAPAVVMGTMLICISVMADAVICICTKKKFFLISGTDSEAGIVNFSFNCNFETCTLDYFFHFRSVFVCDDCN